MRSLSPQPQPLPSQPGRALWHGGGCTVCGGTDLMEFLRLDNVPAQDGLVWDTREAAMAAPTGSIRLAFCRRCGYVGNRTYDAGRVLFAGYDVSLEFSPQYRAFTEAVAARLIGRYDIRRKAVLEIACGKGYFLRTICRLGENRGVGFDPAYADEGADDAGLDITFIRDYYTEKHAGVNADLVACRQVLDILDDQPGFLTGVRRTLQSSAGTVLYFEIPNADATLTRFTPWNVVYEHCSWFTGDVLALFFELHGFEVLDVAPCNDGEYLGLEARPSDAVRVRHIPDALSLAERETGLADLGARFGSSVERWRATLAAHRSAGRRIALWGAGARAIGFLSALDVKDVDIPVADINPRRQGRFLAGTGHRVVPPGALPDLKPDLIVITNPAYAAEIRGQAGELGLTSEMLDLES